MRFERTTFRVGVWHSIQLSYGRMQDVLYLWNAYLSRVWGLSGLSGRTRFSSEKRIFFVLTTFCPPFLQKTVSRLIQDGSSFLPLSCFTHHTSVNFQQSFCAGAARNNLRSLLIFACGTASPYTASGPIPLRVFAGFVPWSLLKRLSLRKTALFQNSFDLRSKNMQEIILHARKM